MVKQATRAYRVVDPYTGSTVGVVEALNALHASQLVLWPVLLERYDDELCRTQRWFFDKDGKWSRERRR